MAWKREPLRLIAIALLVFPGSRTLAQATQSTDAEAIVASLRASHAERVREALVRWRRTPGGGLALLPEVLPLLAQVPHQHLISNAIREFGAEQPVAVGEVLYRAASAPDARPELIRLLADVAPARLVDDEFLAVHGEASTSAMYEIGESVARRAAADPGEIPTFLTLFERTPIQRRVQILQAAERVPGTWRNALWPMLEPYLPTTLCQSVVQLLAPNAAELPGFVDGVRDLLIRGSDTEIAGLAWALQYQPPLAQTLANELVVASRNVSPYGLRHCLRALARVDPGVDGVREVVRLALAHSDREVQLEGLRACALLRLHGTDIAATLADQMRRKPGTQFARSAQAWLWCLDPATGAAPPPEDVASADEYVAIVAVASLAEAAGSVDDAYMPSLRSALQHRDQDVNIVAIRAVARLGERAAELSEVLGQRLASVQPELRPMLLDALLAIGDAGLATVGHSMLYRELELHANWVDALDDRGLPAWIAAATEAARRSSLRVSFPWQQPEVLAKLPPRAREVFTEPLPFLKRVAGDPSLAAAIRVAALKALEDHSPKDPHQYIAMAIAAVGDQQPAVREGAMSLLRQWRTPARDALADIWLSGRAEQRRFAGALLREMAPDTLPPLPPWIARPCLDGDHELRVQAALALLAAGDCGPALSLLGDGASDEVAANVLDGLLRYAKDTKLHFGLITPYLRHGSERLRARAVELVMRTTGAAALQLQAWSIPKCRESILGTSHPWSRPLAVVILTDLMELPPHQRARGLRTLEQEAPGLRPPSPEMSAAIATSWGDAASWKDRALLVHLALALDVDVSFAKPDLARMIADPRDDIRHAGRLAGASLGDTDVLDELRRQLVGDDVSERVGALRALASSGTRLPEWVTAADLVRLSADVPLDDLLRLIPGWTPAGPDEDRAALVKLMLVTLIGGRQPVDPDRLAAALLMLWPQAESLLTRPVLVGRPAAIDATPELLPALGRQRPSAVLELAGMVPAARRGSIIRAAGEGRDESLARPLMAMIDTDDPQLRLSVVIALRCVGPAALPQLLGILRQEPLDVAVLEGLAHWGPAGSDAVTGVMELVRRSDDRQEQGAITKALASLGPRGVVALEVLASEGYDVEAALWSAVEAKEEDASIAALRALVASRSVASRDRLAQLSGSSRSARWQRWLAVVRRQLGEANTTPASFARLAAGLVDPDPRLRQQTVIALTQETRWPSPVAALLVEALWDPQATVRFAAAQRLMTNADAAAQAGAAIAERLELETDERVREALTGR